MSEPTDEVVPPSDASTTEATTETTTDEPLGEPGKRALDAERQARKAAERQANDLAAKVREFEQAQLSETERLNAQLAEAQANAAKAQSEALRLRVASESHLPAELFEFLTGDTEEEVRAKAEKLKAATAAANAPRAPQPDPSQGAKPGSTGPSQLSRADLARMTPQQIEAARQEGRFADLLAGNAN